MKILGIIPVRGGSKGVPKKNIKLLNGKPLIQYTGDIALMSKELTRVIVSTDDDEIIKVATSIGLDVPFKRPKSLSEDKSPTLPVIQHALRYLEDNFNETYDAVCLLQVTTPFRTVEFVDRAIRKFLKDKSDSLISTQKVPHEYNPHWVFTKNAKGMMEVSTGDIEIIARRQELPDAYHRDGSIYITKVDVLLHQNSLFGNSITNIESDPKTYVNIDTIEDWNIAENILFNNE